MYVCVCIHECTFCAYIYVHTYACIHTHMYTYTHMHTHTHTHTHTVNGAVHACLVDLVLVYQNFFIHFCFYFFTVSAPYTRAS
jgi:hypothetical protein